MQKSKSRDYVICPCCGKKNYDRERVLKCTPSVRRSVVIRYFYCGECGCSYVNAPRNIGRLYSIKKAVKIILPIFLAVFLTGFILIKAGADVDAPLSGAVIFIYIALWLVLIFLLCTLKSPPEQRNIKKADNGFVMISAERIGEESCGSVQEKDCSEIRFIPEGQLVYNWNMILPEPNAAALLKCENASAFKNLKINYMYEICGKNFSAYAQLADFDVKDGQVILKLKIFNGIKKFPESCGELFTLDKEKIGELNGIEYSKKYT